MKRFIALYFLYLLILFTLFYADTSLLSKLVNEEQTKLTVFFLKMFLAPGQLQGIDIWINPHYKIIINQACNGLVPILFLFASIFAYPSTLLHKIYWMMIGYTVFTLVNVFRILLVVYFVEQKAGRENFYWSHDLMGNLLLMAVGLGLFITFIKTSSLSLSKRA
ncbi:exosortase/archaeosortase family protein [Sulfurovum sp. XGS-02]|uniref:exosortase/archaeosortase family protein n=1 Tax=Sulfurovum sp. XGS-02 TaxID=2925411 RepID=UPI0020612DE9|nr:exosortase/archaeosortase family protein [Sulfurovum sp. XGS-02]UPT77790.1 exosortase/archaeosortase family protein [Sulfurovum sp. XGS-02]